MTGMRVHQNFSVLDVVLEPILDKYHLDSWFAPRLFSFPSIKLVRWWGMLSIPTSMLLLFLKKRMLAKCKLEG